MPLAEVGEHRVYYEENGDGVPLLLVAGLAADHRAWARQVDAFSPRYRTIVFDNRGVGRSSKPAGPYTIAAMADDAIGLLNELGVGRALDPRQGRRAHRLGRRRQAAVGARLVALHDRSVPVHQCQRGHDLGELRQVLDALAQAAPRVRVGELQGLQAALHHEAGVLASDQADGVGVQALFDGPQPLVDAEAEGHPEVQLRQREEALGERVGHRNRQRGEGQQQRHAVEHQHQGERGRREQRRQHQGFRGADLAGRERPVARAVHVAVEAAVEEIVHRAARRAHEQRADAEDGEDLDARGAARSEPYGP